MVFAPYAQKLWAETWIQKHADKNLHSRFAASQFAEELTIRIRTPLQQCRKSADSYQGTASAVPQASKNQCWLQPLRPEITNHGLWTRLHPTRMSREGQKNGGPTKPDTHWKSRVVP
jgi:hypothetical protein